MALPHTQFQHGTPTKEYREMNQGIPQNQDTLPGEMDQKIPQNYREMNQKGSGE